MVRWRGNIVTDMFWPASSRLCFVAQFASVSFCLSVRASDENFPLPVPFPFLLEIVLHANTLRQNSLFHLLHHHPSFTLTDIPQLYPLFLPLSFGYYFCTFIPPPPTPTAPTAALAMQHLLPHNPVRSAKSARNHQLRWKSGHILLAS